MNNTIIKLPNSDFEVLRENRTPEKRVCYTWVLTNKIKGYWLIDRVDLTEEEALARVDEIFINGVKIGQTEFKAENILLCRIEFHNKI